MDFSFYNIFISCPNISGFFFQSLGTVKGSITVKIFIALPTDFYNHNFASFLNFIHFLFAFLDTKTLQFYKVSDAGFI